MQLRLQSAFEGAAMISDKAFSNELEDIRPLHTESHFLGEDEDGIMSEIHESAGIAEASTEDAVDEDEVIDLNAALGGGIRKAPATVEAENEAEAHAEATA